MSVISSRIYDLINTISLECCYFWDSNFLAMKFSLNKALYSFIVILTIAACASDSGKDKTTDNQQTQQGNNTHVHADGTVHSNDAHAHNHDHDSHSHSSGTQEKYNRKSPPKTQKSTGADYAQKQNEISKQLDEAKGTVPADQWAKKNEAATRRDAQPDPNLVGKKPPKTNLPSACTLIRDSDIAKIINVNANEITLKDGSGSFSQHSQSCFFRWTHNGVPNSGILIQVQDNPLPDEFPEWASYYVAAKINQGEQKPDGSGSFRYKRQANGLGQAAAYSNELSRYIWRINNEYVFMVAFNLPGGEAQKIKWAEDIGKVVMNNF